MEIEIKIVVKIVVVVIMVIIVKMMIMTKLVMVITTILDEGMLNIHPRWAESIQTMDETIFQDLMTDLVTAAKDFKAVAKVSTPRWLGLLK